MLNAIDSDSRKSVLLRLFAHGSEIYDVRNGNSKLKLHHEATHTHTRMTRTIRQSSSWDRKICFNLPHGTWKREL